MPCITWLKVADDRLKVLQFRVCLKSLAMIHCRCLSGRHWLSTSCACLQSMPKIRQHNRPPVQALLVSPWQKKKERTSTLQQQSAGVSDEPLMYSVKTSTSLLSGSPHHHSPTAVSAIHEAAAPTSAAAPITSSTSSHGVSNHCSDSRGPWHVQHRQSVTSAEGPATSPSQKSRIHTPLVRGHQLIRSTEIEVEDGNVSAPSRAVAVVQPSPTATNSQHLTSQEVEGASFSGHVPCMHGTAQLVLFPNGQVSGLCNLCSTSGDAGISHVADNGSSNSKQQCVCLRVEGQQVLGIHSCYRDPEWALLEVRISRHTGPALQTFAAGTLETCVDASAAAAAAVTGCEHDTDAGTSQVDAVTWVQRRGGDLMSLSPADMDDEDTEIAIRNSNLGDLPASMCLLNFTSHTLLSGPTAAAVLGNLEWRSGDALQEVVVNVGEVSIAGLPETFVPR